MEETVVRIYSIKQVLSSNSLQVYGEGDSDTGAIM